jgi:ubiquinone/menaquinone biosynthesis C-methylase UbiE
VFLNPQKIIESLQIMPGMAVADFGAGPGYYSIEAAKAVGANGTVYAIDIRKEALAVIKSRAKLENIQNIETIRADLEKEKSTSIKDGIIDFIIISNILFQAKDKQTIIKEARRILKPDGKIGIIEWNKESIKAGPPLKLRISKEETIDLLQKSGFIFEKEFNAGDQHYGLVFGLKIRTLINEFYYRQNIA